MPSDCPRLRFCNFSLKPRDKGFQVTVPEFLPSLSLLQLRFLLVQKAEGQVEVTNSVSLSMEM